MLKIEDSPLSRFQNEEHYKYYTDVNGLITIFTAATLLIVPEYESFKKSYADEGEALNYVRKSTYTKMLREADTKINNTFDGIVDAVNSGLNHYSQSVKEASERLRVLLDANGNIKRKTQQNKSGATLKLVYELKGSTYATDVDTVELNGWVDKLDADYKNHYALQTGKLNEQDARTHLRMKVVRTEIDSVYRRITEKINALIIVNGEAPYVEFVNKLNLLIHTYENSLSLRKDKDSSAATTPEAK